MRSRCGERVKREEGGGREKKKTERHGGDGGRPHRTTGDILFCSNLQIATKLLVYTIQSCGNESPAFSVQRL